MADASSRVVEGGNGWRIHTLENGVGRSTRAVQLYLIRDDVKNGRRVDGHNNKIDMHTPSARILKIKRWFRMDR